jgi:hypothetical protein
MRESVYLTVMFNRYLIAFFVSLALNAEAHTMAELAKLPSTPEEVCTLEQPREAYRFLKVQLKHSDFTECNRAALDARYWQCMAECEERGYGKNIGGGCAHQVGTNMRCSLPRANTSHCQVFRKHPEVSLREEMALRINEFCTENGYKPLRFR